MKVIFRILLVIAICVMGYLCVVSITTPIKFDEEQARREAAIVDKLIDIRKVQLEYQKQYNRFCANKDTLVDFILNGQISVILKEGTLTDEQLKKGLTEQKAIAIVKRGNQKEIKANGLEGFRRDTSKVSVYKALLEEKYKREEIADLLVIPFSDGKKFKMDTASIINNVTTKTIPLFEVSATYDDYLSDLDHQQLINLKDKQTKLERFCGLKVGSLKESNHGGNWE